jgi:exodeoxyribonuclease VII large subunit
MFSEVKITRVAHNLEVAMTTPFTATSYEDDSSGQGRPLTVSGLNEWIRDYVEGHPDFRRLLVEGEIAGMTKARSGHMYFTLKDAYSQISCVMFQGQRRLLDFDPVDGDRVQVAGELRHYIPRGSLQLQAMSISAFGQGDLFRKFLELKARLQAEGLFEPIHKKAIPEFPSCLGVVSSPDGAVIHDIQRTVERRFPGIPILLAPSLVQGESAVNQLITAMQALDQQPEVEVIILARGGGSLEDLWCFNNEKLVRAVFAMETPVITAIGHETDVTLVDFVADLRAPTPTAAAEIATPDQEELMGQIQAFQSAAGNSLLRQCLVLEQGFDGLEQSIQRNLGYLLEDCECTIVDLAQRIRRGLVQKLFNQEQSLQEIHHRLLRGMILKLDALDQTCSALIQQASVLDIQSVLQRGFSVARVNGKVLRSIKDGMPGELLETLMSDGTVNSRIESTAPVVLARSRHMES